MGRFLHIYWIWPDLLPDTFLGLLHVGMQRSMSMHAVSSQYSIANNVKLDPCIWILHMHCYISLAIAPCYFCIMFRKPTAPVETQNQFSDDADWYLFIPCSHFISYMISHVCHLSSYTGAPSYMGATMEEILTLLLCLFYLHALTGYETVGLSITLVRVKYTKPQVLLTGSSPWNNWFLYIRCSGRGCNIMCFS